MNHCTLNALAVVVFALATVALTPTIAEAQITSPAQVTPRDLRPETSSPGTIALPGAAGLVAPPNAARLSVTLGRVFVEGGFPELQSQTAVLTDPLRSGRVTVADIYAAANALQQAYAAAGYILVRVAIPPQKLDQGGALHLVVLDGFIEAVDVNGVAENQRGLATARMAPLIGRRHVTLAEIERRLLLVSDAPGLTLRSTLARGATPGGALLVLEGTHDSVAGSVGFDDHLSRSLGTFALNSSLALNSVFGFGEQVYGAASSGYDLGKAFDGASPLRVLGGGFSLPIGADGLVVNPEYTNSVTRPAQTLGSPASVGYFDRFDLRGSYPIIRSRAQTLTLQATWEWDEEHLVATGFDEDLYKDNYQVARLQAVDQMLLPWGATTQTTAVFSHGLAGRDSAQATAGAPLSQQGASPQFSKANLDLRVLQPLPLDAQFALIARAQWSFDKPLFLAEQFSLDGADALSAFASGAFSVDQGATLRGELIHPFTLAISGAQATLAPYFFGALGRGFIEEATAVQQPIVDAGSLGLGMRTGAAVAGAPYGASLSVEFARAFSNVANERQGYRGNIALALKF
jgi:hemolysin activation/secretion protein